MPGPHAENQHWSRNVAQKFTSRPRQRGRPRAFDAEVIGAVEVLAANGYSAASIEERLRKRFSDRPLPALRTIQQLVSDMTGSADTDTPWSLLDARDDVEARVVLRVLAYVIVQSGGTRQTLSKPEAAAVSRVHACAPELGGELDRLWTLAYLYVRRQQCGASTLELDLLLAARPWRSRESAQEYADMCDFLDLKQFAVGRQFREIVEDGTEPIVKFVMDVTLSKASAGAEIPANDAPQEAKADFWRAAARVARDAGHD